MPVLELPLLTVLCLIFFFRSIGLDGKSELQTKFLAGKWGEKGEKEKKKELINLIFLIGSK